MNGAFQRVQINVKQLGYFLLIITEFCRRNNLGNRGDKLIGKVFCPPFGFLNILLIQRVFYILDIMELICHTVPKLMSEDNAFIGFALYQFSIQSNIVITHF